MSIKRKARTVAAALIVGCVSAIAAQAASAATPACGPTCLSVFSSELGTYASPNFVEHVFGGRARVGTPTGLTTASSSDPSEDFINPHPGTVADYYALGMVSAAVNRHYGSLTASQLEYTPDGIPSGLCVGIATEPFPGEAVSLQSCTIPGQDRLDHRHSGFPDDGRRGFVSDRQWGDGRFRAPVYDDLSAPRQHGGDASTDPPLPPGVPRPRANCA